MSAVLATLRSLLSALSLAFAMTGCDGDKGSAPVPWDADGDGAPAEGGMDCDDADPRVHPGAEEACDDGVDNDCDSSLDLDDLDCQVPTDTGFLRDADGDGYDLPEDCDDSDASVHPGAVERCEAEGEEARDDDCGGTFESDDPSRPAANCTIWYPDLDGDGQGDASDAGTCTCSPPAETGWVDNALDCEDGSALAYQGAPTGCATEEFPDADCDDTPDPAPADCTYWYRDDDGDGEGDPNDYKCECEAPEGYVANDDGCDSDAMDNYVRDADGDGYGAAAEPEDGSPRARWLCTAEGYYSVLNSNDCDDDDPSTYPGAADDCGGTDRDCDFDAEAEEIDEQDTVGALNCTDFYLDRDDDGFGSSTDDPFCLCSTNVEDTIVPTMTLARYADYTSTVSTDCDDSDDSRSPGLEEDCDEVDNDCDGVVDDNADDGISYYPDADGDGQGDGDRAASTMCAWEAERDGYVSNNLDCDDGDETSFTQDDPAGNDLELCDGADNDCDEVVDENLRDYYTIDADGDGFGNDGSDGSDPLISWECKDSHTGWAALATDCKDENSSIYPGNEETCNGIDDDCDAVVASGDVEDDPIDEGLTGTYYEDNDSDSFGAGDPVEICRSHSYEYSANDDDCDDENRFITTAELHYPDADGDEEGDESDSGIEMCPDEATALGYVDNNTDCDDSDKDINSAAVELCNNKDEDCDNRNDNGLGWVYHYYLDVDGDGCGDLATLQVECKDDGKEDYITENFDDLNYVRGDHLACDCDDSDDSVYTGADEICDGQDNDCDSGIDDADEDDTDEKTGCCDSYIDYDGDGFGEDGASVGCVCTPDRVSTPQTSLTNTDCSALADEYPGAEAGALDCDIDAADIPWNTYTEDEIDYTIPVLNATPDSCWLLPGTTTP